MTLPEHHQIPEDSRDRSAPPQPRWRRWLAGQHENIWILAIALVIAVIMRLVVAEPRFIPSDSMEPTLHIGDRLLVEKLSYRFHPPQPGDIVVFRPPPQLQAYGYTSKQAFIKRVIALPGDTVVVKDQQVWVNDRPLSEPYLREPPDYTLPPLTVPPGSVFVLGDNRNDSNDSHVWGFLPQANIIGRAQFRFWPPARWGTVAIAPPEAAATAAASASTGLSALGSDVGADAPLPSRERAIAVVR